MTKIFVAIFLISLFFSGIVPKVEAPKTQPILQDQNKTSTSTNITEQTTNKCQKDSDCPALFKCFGGECVAKEPGECSSDAECANGTSCFDERCIDPNSLK